MKRQETSGPDRAEDDAPLSPHVTWQPGDVSAAERASLLRQRPVSIWITGLPASGKSTLALALERRLVDGGHACYVLDGDNLRHGLNRGLGFSPEDRRENIRRVAEVTRLMNDAGLVTIVSLVSPLRGDRAMARAIIGDAFREVYLSTPLATCEARDPKGLYAKARRGAIAEFTGVSAPYEPPEAPDLALDTTNLPVASCVEQLAALLR